MAKLIFHYALTETMGVEPNFAYFGGRQSMAADLEQTERTENQRRRHCHRKVADTFIRASQLGL